MQEEEEPVFHKENDRLKSYHSVHLFSFDYNFS